MKSKLIILGLSCGLFMACTATDNADDAAANGENSNAIPSAPMGGGQDAATDDQSAKNILQIAIGSADHSTLVAAVKAAELTHVLANNGPLTVFAPTNAAFEALPAGTVDELLKPENKTKLQQIITFHAAPGTYAMTALKNGMNLFVATGNNLKVEIREDGTYVDGAKILGSVPCSNGIVHVVDKVLLPPSN